MSVRPSVRPSVGPSVGHTRVEFLRNGPNLNKIVSSMPFDRQFKNKYAGRPPENASVVRTLFDLFRCVLHRRVRPSVGPSVSQSVRPSVGLSARVKIVPFLTKIKISKGLKQKI